MSRIARVILPVLVLAIAVLGMMGILKMRKETVTQERPFVPPLVRTVVAQPQSHRFVVRSQGTVAPRTGGTLLSEVSGRVLRVSDVFAAGEFFEKEEILLWIDPADYKAAVARSQAEVAAAKLRLAREVEESQVAREEWERLNSISASDLTLRKPQLEEARAALAASEAALEKARRDLDNTQIRAPYAGRIRQKSVDMGGFLSRGMPVASIYAVDVAEIRLPIPDGDLAYIDLPLSYRDATPEATGMPSVQIRAEFAGQWHEWQGRIVRTEGEIDARSRMVHVIAQVEDPYGFKGDTHSPPLSVGLFVEAEIQGHEIGDVFVLPRSVMRDEHRLLTVDSEERLRFREVEIERYAREIVIIRSGLQPGDRVCLSRLEAVVDGMQVRPMKSGEQASDSPAEENR